MSGGIDLSPLANKQQPPAAGPAPSLPPARVELTEQNLQATVVASQQVPVIVTLGAGSDQSSQQNVQALEALAARNPGAFQLAVVDIETAPQVAGAFGIQRVPYTLVLLAGRPVPLYEGEASAAELDPLWDQVRQLAVQQGVTGKTAAPGAQAEPEPLPPLHVEAQAAIEAGDLAAAEAAYLQALKENPRDREAEAALAQVRLMVRLEAGGDVTDPFARADQLVASGHPGAALELLLEQVAATSGEEREAARARLVELFTVLGPSSEVDAARRRLSTLIM
ncbi:tetratricopeptide repeat protein [Buchananella hordeovulneris]|uniref:tetratricopeptide repeat protein n=1 Tax=Buchananella hordeovulneris TaxID=52770 RepID=UPI000F5E9C98|nr:tetratricopeptide repeat protein [Buchananella hordeovulneris]RRD45104.1 co-chaperone YbbN [Buchananella hordeovulneris]RRD53084.1 co-chaperone YbbN [Buchananella hordeovulneris]